MNEERRWQATCAALTGLVARYGTVVYPDTMAFRMRDAMEYGDALAAAYEARDAAHAARVIDAVKEEA